MKTSVRRLVVITLAAAVLAAVALPGLAQTRGVEHAARYDRLVIRGAIVIDGNVSPPRGPLDVVVEGNRIAAVRGSSPRDEDYAKEARVLDARGLFLLPGLIDSHVHLQDERGGKAMPFAYQNALWLGCGITTVRDVGSDLAKALEERRASAEGGIAAPRIYVYGVAGGKTPEAVRARVRELKKAGVDGIKLFGMDRDLFAAAAGESQAQGLRVAHHAAIEEADAADAARLGIASIEHWYGIPDAALNGTQKLPPDYNFADEVDRFRWAGRLWRETDSAKLDEVLRALVAAKVAWVPTFAIYEANRDLVRAMNQPWYADYLHPALEAYFRPNPGNHGSYHWGWTTEDEIFWKENFRLWMAAVRRFADLGGVVGCGEDAGFIYQAYGFAYLRELELMQEAGFHPIDVVRNATLSNARILGLEDRLGRVREGWLADLVVVPENPLENFKTLNPWGIDDLRDGRPVRRGGVRWTIKDGIVYDARVLLDGIKEMVKSARATN